VAVRQLEGAGRSNVARFSPDGRRIATATTGSTRDAATGRLVRELPAGDDSSVDSVAFSPTDHRLLATGHGGRAGVSYVALWDLDTGTQLARLPGATDLPGFQVDENSGRVSALAFSPDGKYLVSGFGSRFSFTSEGSANPLKVWEVATRRLDRLLDGHTGYCVSIHFSKDGTLLASASRDGTAIVWSARTWQAVHTLRNPEGDTYVWDTAFSPDPRHLAMAVQSGNVLLWDVATGKLLETLTGHSNTVTAVAFSPDGRTLASGSWDQTVRLWNAQTRRELMRLDQGDVRLGPLETLSFSPDGKHLMAGGRSGTAVWSAAPAPGRSDAGR
jgi:WD40 repeat protein